jgi:hypothetical protein
MSSFVLRETPMTFDEVLGEVLGDDMLDIAHVNPVDGRLAQGIPKKTLVLGVAVAWRARTRAGACTRRRGAKKSDW